MNVRSHRRFRGGPADAGGGGPILKVLAGVTLPMYIAMADTSSVASALPTIAADLGDADRLPWIVVSFLLATTVSSTVYGRLGDTFGRRRLLMVALLITIVGSVAAALASNMSVLIGCRVLQGLGAGGLLTLSSALIGESVAPRVRARYHGFVAGTALASTTIGPVAGGFMASQFGWRAVFLMNLPIALLAIPILLRLPAIRPPRRSFHFDYAGVLLLATFATSILLLVNPVGVEPADVGIVRVVLGIIGLLALTALVVVERRQAEPLLPSRVVGNSAIWRSDTLGALQGAMTVAVLTIVPIYLRAHIGLSSTQIGLMLLPSTIGLAIGAALTGTFVGLTGRTTIFPMVALCVTALCFVALALLPDDIGIVELAIVLAMAALGLGSVMTVVQVTVQSAAEPGDLGTAGATIQLSRAFGSGFGVALVSTVLFTALSASGSWTTELIAEVLRNGPSVLDTHGQGLVLERELFAAFRVAFLTLAAIALAGAAMAAWIPVRRV